MELFILFHRHQGSMNRSEDALANKNTLQKEVAAFKKLSRRVFSLTCPAEKEWMIKPSTTRRNRLREIAVANKHASIRGMPIMCKTENKQIVKRLLALRGVRTVKQKKLWEDGNLQLKPTVISLKGSTKVISINDKDELLTNWVAKGFHGEDAWSNMHAIKLRHMSCPGCRNRVEVSKLKLVKGAQFSNLTCSACHIMTNSKFWRCDCDLLWHKCCLHVKGYDENKTVPKLTKQIRKHKVVKKGLDTPLPSLRLRCNEGHAVEIGSSSRDYYRVSLPPGSRLALRFPHFAKQVMEQPNVNST